MTRGIAAAAALFLASGSALAADGEGEAAAAAAADPAAALSAPFAERYEELLASFEEIARAARQASSDEVAQLEAEEIAAIAEEIVAEGDSGLAASLLEEAIAILAGEGE